MLYNFKKLKSRDFSIYLLTMFGTFYSHKSELISVHKAELSFLLLEVFVKHFIFEEITTKSTLKDQYELSYHLGGIYNNMLLWLSHEMAESPEEMTEIATSYSLPILFCVVFLPEEMTEIATSYSLRNNVTLFELYISKTE